MARMVGSPRDGTNEVLLETKLFPPRWRGGLVARPHLVDHLDRGVEAKLTLVSAPAGSGKTTLLGEWLADREAPVAWLSLDPDDSDPTRFWSYVVRALQTVDATLGSSALAVLQSSSHAPIDVALTTLLNEIASRSDDLCLVLDDYHVIESAPVHDSLALFLERMPRQMHLLIASRADPALPLPRLRARGELVEVRAADLRFSPDEAASFLNEAMGLAVSAHDIAALERRTEGWIAGLQLAALSMRGRDDVGAFVSAFTGDSRFVVDYLVEEVLQRQSPSVRDFLLQTSILHRLSGPLCEAVTTQTGGRATLEDLDRANLFLVPLDDRRDWYRYHHLFGDVLRAHLKEEQPQLLPELHRRASDWYAAVGRIPEAIDHALHGGHLELAAELISSIAREMVRTYRPLELLGWLRQIPDETIERHPLLCAYYAFGLFPAGEMEAAVRWLDVASRLVEDPPPAPTEEAARELESLPGVVAIARGYHAMALGDLAGTVDQSRFALASLPEREHTWRAGAGLLLSLVPWRLGDLDEAAEAHAQAVRGLEEGGDTALAISAIYDAGKLATLRGRLAEAHAHYERALALFEAADDPTMPGAADAHLGLSEVALERGDLEAATEHYEAAEAFAERALLPETLSRLAIGRAALHEAAGDFDAAIADLNEAEGLVVPATVPSHPVDAMRAREALLAGRIADVEAWLAASDLSPEDAAAYPREYEHLTLVRLFIHRAGDSDLRVARDLLARLLEAARGRRTGSVIEILILQALAAQAAGDMADASASLSEALTLAEPEGYQRLFVVEGGPMRELLRDAIVSGHSTAYATSLLEALGDTAPPEGGANTLPEPLTSREVEILRLIAAGMRNQEIADHLVISVATVKRHIANTYGKLGVDHRTEAVVRANELQLI